MDACTSMSAGSLMLRGGKFQSLQMLTVGRRVGAINIANFKQEGSIVKVGVVGMSYKHSVISFGGFVSLL